MPYPPLSTPRQPVLSSPPSRLVALADSLHHPAIQQIGLTTTPQGEWALMVTTAWQTPIAAIEKSALDAGFSVVYEIADDLMAVARPAFPARGE
jgi:hypothetical protein